mgnify:CR=1 FL=1
MANKYVEALASLHGAMGSILSLLRDNPELLMEDANASAETAMSKEELQERLSSVAKDIAASGEKPTLAECARRVGVPYYRAVYAMKGIELPS